MENWYAYLSHIPGDFALGNGYRNSYHKATELIVVLGEILEENGESGTMKMPGDCCK